MKFFLTLLALLPAALFAQTVAPAAPAAPAAPVAPPIDASGVIDSLPPISVEPPVLDLGFMVPWKDAPYKGAADADGDGKPDAAPASGSGK